MNLSTDLPLYESIRRELQGRIESGELQDGDRIVPEIDLAKQLGVSRSTARKALQCLTDDGFISRTAGRGSFVLPRNHRGQLPGGRVLELAICSADVVASGGEVAQGFLCETLAAGCAAIAWPWNAPGEALPHGASGCAVWAGEQDEAAATYLAEARRANTPVVLIDASASMGPADHVFFDHEGLACALAAELILKGHRSIGIVTGSLARPFSAARANACRNALLDGGIPVTDGLIISGELGSTSDLQLDLLAMLGRRERPTALCCLHESLSPWLIRAIQDLGYTLDKDIDVALAVHPGQQDLPHGVSARLDVAAAGREAAKMLLRRLESPSLAPQSATAGYIFSAKL